jgi:hypothetical protein
MMDGGCNMTVPLFGSDGTILLFQPMPLRVGRASSHNKSDGQCLDLMRHQKLGIVMGAESPIPSQ